MQDEDGKYIRPKLIEFNLDKAITEIDVKPINTQHSDKFDWALIRAEYVNNRALTLKDLAHKYGCSEITVRLKSGKENWVIDRQRVNQEFVKVTTQENLRRQAKAAIHFNTDCLEVSRKILRLVHRRVDEIEASGSEVDANEMGHLARAAKQSQEAGRLALGLTTNSTELKDGSKEESRSMDDINAELIMLLGEEAFNAINMKTLPPEARK